MGGFWITEVLFPMPCAEEATLALSAYPSVLAFPAAPRNSCHLVRLSSSGFASKDVSVSMRGNLHD